VLIVARPKAVEPAAAPTAAPEPALASAGDEEDEYQDDFEEEDESPVKLDARSRTSSGERPTDPSETAAATATPRDDGCPPGLSKVQQMRWRRLRKEEAAATAAAAAAEAEAKRAAAAAAAAAARAVLSLEVVIPGYEGEASSGQRSKERGHRPRPPGSKRTPRGGGRKARLSRHRSTDSKTSPPNKARLSRHRSTDSKLSLPNVSETPSRGAKVSELRSPDTALPSLPALGPTSPGTTGRGAGSSALAQAKAEQRRQKKALKSIKETAKRNARSDKKDAEEIGLMYKDALELRAFVSGNHYLSDGGKDIVLGRFQCIDRRQGGISLDEAALADNLQSVDLSRRDRNALLKSLRQRRAEIRNEQKRNEQKDREARRELQSMQAAGEEKSRNDKERMQQVRRLQKLFGSGAPKLDAGGKPLRRQRSKGKKSQVTPRSGTGIISIGGSSNVSPRTPRPPISSRVTPRGPIGSSHRILVDGV